jgi:hypothetical protein
MEASVVVGAAAPTISTAAPSSKAAIAITLAARPVIEPTLMINKDRHMEPIRPNHYVLKGQDIEVTYNKHNITGQPVLDVEYKGTKQNFIEENIKLEVTEIGELVTVLLRSEPERATITLTLLIPLINLDGHKASTFQTEAIITEHLTGIVGPGLVKGAIQKYLFVPLEGTASIVYSEA